MSNTQAQTSDELEIAEAQNSLFDLLYDYAAKAVTTRVGQFAYRRVDSFLSTVEKTARWSLPQPSPSSDSKQTSNNWEDGKMNISPPPLIRPLPWLLFLPALIYLRFFRSALSFMALILGRQPVYAETMVIWLQNKRRKIRALKYRGQKLERINRAERRASKLNNEPQTTWLSKITLPLRMVICSRGSGRVSSSVVVRRPHRHQHKQSDSTASQKAKKRNVEERDDGDSSSEDSMDDSVNCQELLNRYVDDAGDSSFNVDDRSSDSSDSFISETEKSALEDESSKESEQKPSRKPSQEAQKNGHAPPEKTNTNGNSNSTGQQQKPAKAEDPKKPKSALNVENGEKRDKAVEHNPSDQGKQASGGKHVNSANRSKSAASLEPDQPVVENESHAVSSKSTPDLTPSSEGQENNENKPLNQNTPDKHAASMSEVKTNFQHKNNKHQQPNQHQNQQHQNQQHQNQQHQQNQNQHQHQPHQHHQQQNAAAVNGGGKKHKRPSHGN